MRKSTLTKERRQDIYDTVAEMSIIWVSMTPEQLAKVATELLMFTVDHEDKTKEQLLRIVFLAHMKRMIG